MTNESIVSGATCRGARAAQMVLAARSGTADPAWLCFARQWNGVIGKNGSQWKYLDEVSAVSAKYPGRWRVFQPNIGQTESGAVDCPVQNQHFFSGGLLMRDRTCWVTPRLQRLKSESSGYGHGWVALSGGHLASQLQISAHRRSA